LAETVGSGEKDYRQLILDEYTFLKRPVIINDTEVLVGNTLKKVS
jgi:arsenate reductase-like glutaredoxin family protein